MSEVQTQWLFNLGEELCEQVVCKVEKRKGRTVVIMFFAPYSWEIHKGDDGAWLLEKTSRYERALHQARMLGDTVKRSYTQTLIIPEIEGDRELVEENSRQELPTPAVSPGNG